ncbi:MAG: RNA polymerase sigma factor [Gammaproteobacteria bacterium]
MENALTSCFERIRGELHAYLCRLVVRPQVAEDLLQTTYLRCLEASDHLPETGDGIRAWLFKVATNLAFDELRKHSTWRENMILDLRDAAEANPALIEQSKALASTPETRAIAREHLVACLACTLRNLPEQKAAALLLREVHGFTSNEVADLLDASPGQAKNWLQEARHYMTAHYGTTCTLISKTGVCHQCIELDDFFPPDRAIPYPVLRISLHASGLPPSFVTAPGEPGTGWYWNCWTN